MKRNSVNWTARECENFKLINWLERKLQLFHVQCILVSVIEYAMHTNEYIISIDAEQMKGRILD